MRMDPHPFVTARTITTARPAPRRIDVRSPLALVVAALLAAALAVAMTSPALGVHTARTA